jgi:hypothetical protein
MSGVTSRLNSPNVADESAPLALRPGKSTAILMLFASLLFVAAGLGTGDSSGYFCAAFFSPVILAFTIRLLPKQ